MATASVASITPGGDEDALQTGLQVAEALASVIEFTAARERERLQLAMSKLFDFGQTEERIKNLAQQLTATRGQLETLTAEFRALVIELHKGLGDIEKRQDGVLLSLEEAAGKRKVRREVGG